MDNMSLKEIQSKLLLWEAAENPLAPLTAEQREAILDLESLIVGVGNDTQEESSEEKLDQSELTSIPSVDSTYNFLNWYESLCDQNVKADDSPYEDYYRQLEDRRNECVSLNNQIGATMDDLNKLSEQYELVSNKTNALHTMSEQLLADQNKLSSIGDDIKQKLHYFTQVEHLSQRLNSPTMSVNSEAFFIVLAKIDECLEYMKNNNNFKESHTYLVKYRHLQSRAISLIRSYVIHILNHATEQVLAPSDEDPADPQSIDTAYAVYFGKFQAAAPKLRMVISEVEARAETNADYASLLSDVQREYASRRARVAGAAAQRALHAARAQHARDHCSLLRAACSLLAHACRDECALYTHLFARPSPALHEYLQSLCNGLYETLRPHIIHINHLETLAELCVILRVEVIEEQVNNDPESLSALGACARALLQDAQERLVFRAHVHLRADVLRYRPAPGDLAYPEKLEMMEQIAQSIQEQASLRRSGSRASLASDASDALAADARRAHASPADLHGMWYPGVRRTLAALSRLYRCLEKRVFQGLAQEAISLCVQSIDIAAKQISANKTNIDGELFQIKHLLILREQIAPFQVDFIVKETTLDFSNMKNAAYGLIQKPRQIFSLNSNNALLEFLLEGTPMVREHLLDSRKEVDRQLKACCETFIKDATELLAGPMIGFVEKVQQFTPVEQLSSQSWATAEKIAEVVKEAQKRVKGHLAPLQRSMQLYLANKETEFILFRPIRNNVVGFFAQVHQTLSSGYSAEDALIAACPSPEQVSVFISSAGLLPRAPAPPYGRRRSAARPPGLPPTGLAGPGQGQGGPGQLQSGTTQLPSPQPQFAPVQLQSDPAQQQSGPAQLQSGPTQLQSGLTQLQSGSAQQPSPQPQFAPVQLQSGPPQLQSGLTQQQSAPAQLQSAPVQLQGASTQLQSPQAQSAPVQLQNPQVQSAPVQLQSAPILVQGAPVQLLPATPQVQPSPVQLQNPSMQLPSSQVQFTPVQLQNAPAQLPPTNPTAQIAPMPVQFTPVQTQTAPGQLPPASSQMQSAFVQLSPRTPQVPMQLPPMSPPQVQTTPEQIPSGSTQQYQNSPTNI